MKSLIHKFITGVTHMNTKYIGMFLIALGTLALFLITLAIWNIEGLAAVKATGWYMVVLTIILTILSQTNLEEA